MRRKTNCNLHAHSIFLRLKPADWRIPPLWSVVMESSNYFGFGFTIFGWRRFVDKAFCEFKVGLIEVSKEQKLKQCLNTEHNWQRAGKGKSFQNITQLLHIVTIWRLFEENPPWIWSFWLLSRRRQRNASKYKTHVESHCLYILCCPLRYWCCCCFQL